jgi:hypothetical protein
LSDFVDGGLVSVLEETDNALQSALSIFHEFLSGDGVDSFPFVV